MALEEMELEFLGHRGTFYYDCRRASRPFQEASLRSLANILYHHPWMDPVTRLNLIIPN